MIKESYYYYYYLDLLFRPQYESRADSSVTAWMS